MAGYCSSTVYIGNHCCLLEKKSSTLSLTHNTHSLTCPLLTPKCTAAYAMLDHKEFFAEMSVTYLCNSYHELDNVHDTTTTTATSMVDCCPPLLEPNTTHRVLETYRYQQQQQHATEETDDDGDDQHHNHRSRTCCGWFWFLPQPLTPSFSSSSSTPLLTRQRQHHQNRRGASPISSSSTPNYPRIIDPIFQETSLHRNCLGVKHCNKFYPFTRGQLKYHDRATYNVMEKLWTQDIANWEDPNDFRLCSRPIKWILNIMNNIRQQLQE